MPRVHRDAQSSGVAGYLLRPHPLRSLAISAGFLLSGLLEGLGIGAVLPLLNLVIRGNLDSAGRLGRLFEHLLTAVGLRPEVGPFLTLIVTAFLVKAGISYAVLRLAILTASGIVVRTRRRLLRALLGARWDFFQSQPAGRLGNAIGLESEQIADLYLLACRMAAGLIQVVVYLALAFTISWALSLCALALAGLGFIFFNSLVERMRRSSARFFERMRSLIRRLVDALQGFKPLKAMGLERQTGRFLDEDIAALRTYRARSEMHRVSLETFRDPVQLITAGLAFFISYRFLRIGFAEMAVTLVIFTRVVDSVIRLQGHHQNFARLEPAFRSVGAIIAEAETWREELGGGPCPVFQRRIRLAHVDFRRGPRTILEDASLEIPAGRTTMLRGPSGAGKTTLADLVCGVNRPDRGRVLIDGVPLDRVDLKAWRVQIGYVPQELFLFHDTILNNVTLGESGVGPEEVESALRAVGAWDFVRSLPDGLRTVVGEAGSKLSGGQRQRIAIARALARRPRLLVLDEATSGLDPKAETGLILSLKKMAEPPAVLVISHRSSFSRAADVVYSVEGTRVRRVRPRPRGSRTVRS